MSAERPALPPAFAGRLVAILRAQRADRFMTVAETLAAAGVRAIEITLTSAGALAALGEARERFGHELALGAGSVLDAAAVDAAVDAGATYVVSPGLSPEVVSRCRQRGVAAAPGALTATEVMAAWRAGAAAVKLFPAATVGPRYLEHLRAPLAHIPLLPTGGIELADVDRFLRAGAIAVGVGGPLLGDAAQGGSLSELACRARTFVNAAEAAGA